MRGLTERAPNRWRDCGFLEVVVPYPVELDETAVWPSGKNKIEVLFVANLYPEKRTEVIALEQLNASSRYEVSLHIYGVSNQDAHSLKQAIERCGFRILSEGGDLSHGTLKAYPSLFWHRATKGLVMSSLSTYKPACLSNSDGISQMIPLIRFFYCQGTMNWSVVGIHNPEDVRREMERFDF